jgi:hypothetical protein
MVPYRGLFRFEICEASRLDCNFQKPEGPHQIGRSFQKKILFSGKLRLGRNLKIRRKKWTGAFHVDISFGILPFEL